MTIDVWGLGLQAVNVLILVWLLSRVFWRPVAGAIARRQDAATAIVNDATAVRAEADAALAEATKARDGIAEERKALLAEAAAKAEAAAAAALADARETAAKLVDAAERARARDAEATRKAQAAQAAELAVDIAARLLQRLDAPALQAAFLALLVEALAAMPADDRAALAASESGLELVGATEPDDADRARITTTVADALGGAPGLTFVTNPDLIAGFELRSPHFVLLNSWRSDLDDILKDLEDAA